MKLRKSKTTLPQRLTTPLRMRDRRTHGVMQSIRKRMKLLAAFFIVNFLSSLVAPNVAHALTSGPTAPEYTSFEPVDTTDMVNLATGDFVYNLPLLEVPGPAGGYPLSLSYHAGIQPNEEASWVGLGWTLNPGAITRTVNGYPDDQLGATRTRRDFIFGGQRNTFSVGVGIGPITYGLSFSNDTYQGFSMGSSMSIGYSLFNTDNNGLGLGVNASFGSDGYGNTFGGIGAGLSFGKTGAEAKGLSGSIGISSNFNSVSLSGGVGFRENSSERDGVVGTVSSQSLLGASISSKGLKPSVTAAGYSSSQHNSKSGNWTITSSGWSIPVPLGPVLVSIGKRYMRYYVNETSDLQVIGSLYGNELFEKNFDTWSYDSYALTEVEKDYTEQEPEKDAGGSFPGYDQYNVTAQGLSGSIRPFHSNLGRLQRQNLKTSDQNEYEIQYLSDGRTLPKPYFRFLNDFSNTYTYDDNVKLDASTFSVENGSPMTDPKGYINGRVAGSKDVQTFTNLEIKNGAAKSSGLIDYTSYTNRRTEEKFVFRNTDTDDPYDLSNLIGAYKITNESGVTFHYALPVYEYGEYQLNQKKGNEIGSAEPIYTTMNQKEPYAYTWLLTAVTGPDFVDRNNNGLADDEDWGYWVKMDYGRWTDKNGWRSPYEGYHSDLDSEYETVSYGHKEMYYLNKISTKSHVAIFEKEIRADSKSVVNSSVGGFTPYMTNLNSPTFIEYPVYPISSLKLNSIYLLNRSKDIDLKNKSSIYNHTFHYESPPEYNLNYETSITYHEGDNIIDVHDLDETMSAGETYRQYLTENALRIISFDHSYELQDTNGNAGLPNSFDEDASMYSKNFVDTEDDVKLGKLTLDKIKFKGKGGEVLIPSMAFKYDKNPTWEKGHYDIWGFYKSDFNQTLFDQNENLGRMVSPTSALDVDAWSLSRIKTSLGSDIQIIYESDQYKKPELYEKYLLSVTDYDYLNNIIYFPISYENLDEILLEEKEITFLYKWEVEQNGVKWHYNSRQKSKIKSVVSNQNDNYAEIYEIPDPPGRGYSQSGTWCKLTNTNIEIDEYIHTLILHDCDECVYLSEATGEQYKVDALQKTIGDINITSERFVSGTISISDGEYNFVGGGLRVKSISTGNDLSKRTTSYEYNDLIQSAVSSGITSFEPYGKDLANYLVDIELNNEFDQFRILQRDHYEKFLNEDLSHLLSISRELQAPGVIYKYVTVSDEVNGQPALGKQVYNFQVFEEDFVERAPIKNSNGMVTRTCQCPPVPPSINNFCPEWTGTLSELQNACATSESGIIEFQVPSDLIEPMTIRDFTTRVGNLKSVKTYGENNQLLVETKTVYQYDLDKQKVALPPEHENYWIIVNGFVKSSMQDKFNNQGVTHEMFTEHRLVKQEDGSFENKKVFSRKEYYPAVVVKTETINHKTGITSETKNLAFDFYSGDPTITYSDDGYGNQYVTKSIPAYHYYTGAGGMGLAINGGKNMLTQEGTSYSYLMNDGFDPYTFTYLDDVKTSAKGLVAASAQSWSNTIPSMDGGTAVTQDIWRKHQSFSYIAEPTDNIL